MFILERGRWLREWSSDGYLNVFLGLKILNIKCRGENMHNPHPTKCPFSTAPPLPSRLVSPPEFVL